MLWTKELFGVQTPIIAMCHLLPLPNDPQYDETAGIAGIAKDAIQTVQILQEEGVHGILFSNEFSYPYVQKAPQINVATMARIIGETKQHIKVPFGVDCMYDAFSSIDLAVATDANFYRIALTQVTLSAYEYGTTRLGYILRYAMEKRCKYAKNIISINSAIENCGHINDIKKFIKTIEVQSFPDALCLSAKSIERFNVDSEDFRNEGVSSVALFCDGGCNQDSVKNMKQHTDGIIVGTALKENMELANATSRENVRSFMSVYHNG